VSGYVRKDHWYRKAKEEGYRSRSAYKLIELHKRYHLFRRGMKVVDLGCAPGGWMQVTAQEVGPSGRVVGIDLEPTEPLGLPQVHVLTGDIRHGETLSNIRNLLEGPCDLLLSDMAPDTSGVGFADHARSIELVSCAFGAARVLLRPGGTFLSKVFDGPDLSGLISEMKTLFGHIKRVRPEASRKASREIYLLASPRLDIRGTENDAQNPLPKGADNRRG
jgi:23S rRNA (uridine2552-2'-O)-methyltransferase